MSRFSLKATGLLMLPLAFAACSDDGEDLDGAGTIVEVASSDAQFSTLVSAIEAADLADTLNGDGPFTVFAPTNAAFEALPAGTLDALLQDTDALRDVLTYHVVSGRVDAAQVVTLSSATTLQGSDVSITVDGDVVRINGARVTQTDIETDNGIIHVIDAVLTPPEEGPGTIVDVAAADENFSTLVTAIQAADLTDTLNGAGPFTVFAPTNDAFDALPAGTLDALLADIPALTDVLTYHVVAGRVDSTQVVELSSATTVQGQDVMIRVENGEVFINDAKVTMTDIEASNGIIHVIDAVLVPETEPGTIVDIAAADENFSTLVTAIQAAGLTDTLNGEGPFTVFAPTNDAFDALPAGTLDALLADIPELTKILTYHVVPGEVTAEQVIGLTSATSVQGAEISIRVENGDVFVNDAQVIMTDIQASNGIIHVIDAVITPPTIVDIATSNPAFSTLVTALQAADLVDTLNGPGPFTVFAPTNDAFDKIPQADLQALLADVAALTDVLTYHVVSGDVRAADVATLRAADTVQGTSIIISTANGVMVNDAMVTMTDIVAGNGVIHVIDTVITPGTVADLVGYDPDLSTLGTAVAAANLGGTLSGMGPFTVFAPDNAAFDALPMGTLDGLLNDIPGLTNVLTYHVIADEVTSDEVVNLTSATTVQGEDVSIAVNNGNVTINDANVVAVDIKGTNGVIHVIDAVLLPTSM